LMPEFVFLPGAFRLREAFEKLPGRKMHRRLALLLDRA
jgi:hypothetical protein